MRALLFSLLFSVGGVCVLSALDSTLIFFLPLAVDAGVVIITTHHPDLFWLFPFLVSGCSLIGAAVTYYLGREIEEAGLERFIPPKRIDKIRKHVRAKGAIGMAALDLIPPPFPFTAFILTSGALEVDALRFFIGIFVFRVVRFGIEATLAAIYGRRIISWLQSPFVRDIAYFFTVVVVGVSMVTLVQFIRKSRRLGKGAARKAA